MKKGVIVLMVFLILFSMIYLYSDREEPQKRLSAAPLNPEFLRYRDRFEAGRLRPLAESGYLMGYAPAPVSLSHVRGYQNPATATSYPATYDLRTQNKLTAVRNQGECGACWAFGALASLESSLKPTETADYSEQDLNHTHGFDYLECVGGNGWMSAAYLTRWSGPLKESDVPYPYAPPPDGAGFTPQKHVQQVIFLPDRADYLDNDTVKYFVTQVGAVSFSFRSVSSLYNGYYNSYYYNGSDDTNHIVAVVGWDDNYPVDRFIVAPPGPGAFLVKNSWGSTWGDDGYFYISYYDKSMSEFVSFSKPESATNYQRIYQYDPLGWVTNVGLQTTPVFWSANIFTAASSQPVRAVGFYTNDTNVQYEIYVYRDVTPGQPRSGVLAATASGTKTYPGFYTEPLSQIVPVTDGSRFSVVIKFTNSTYNYPLAAEEAQDGYSSQAEINAGESFYSEAGTDWEDLGAYGYNACIKAYAGTVATYQLTLQSSANGTTNPVPGSYPYVPGTQAQVQAVPDTHGFFTGWSGDASGTTNPLSVTMDRNRTVKANFRAILAPLNAAGQRVLNRSFSQAEYINILSWQANAGNDGLGIATYRIYAVGDQTALLAEVPATQTQYQHRMAGSGARTYIVAAVTSSGREGFPATISLAAQ